MWTDRLNASKKDFSLQKAKSSANLNFLSILDQMIKTFPVSIRYDGINR